jgi:hypothetical protein
MAQRPRILVVDDDVPALREAMAAADGDSRQSCAAPARDRLQSASAAVIASPPRASTTRRVIARASASSRPPG